MDLYHVLNRGVDKRQIFMDDRDHFRFVHDLFEFNDQVNVGSKADRDFIKSDDIECRPIKRNRRRLLVDIHAFCLIHNHYHLFLSERVKGGIPMFMHKLNMGYAKYFNTKHDRSGALFQGRYKSVKVDNDAHFLHLPYYIHSNPLDMYMPEWRDGKIRDYRKAMRFLENYRWSSFPDYIGKKNFPSVTSRDFLLDFFRGRKKYREQFVEWLRDMEIEGIKDVLLE
jgi:putative transposase